MGTHRVSKVRRFRADQILSGDAIEPRSVVTVLRAAAAPPTARELDGEQGALHRFRAERFTSVTSQRRPALRKRTVAKALTGAVAAIVASGGAALAAANHDVPSSVPTTAQALSKAPSPKHSAAAPKMSEAPKPAALPSAGTRSASAKPSHPSSHATPSPSLIGLCVAYQAGATDNPGKALDSPAFAALVAAAKGKDKVPAYCTIQLASVPSHGSGAPSGHPNNRPTTSVSSHPAGPRSTIPPGPLASPGPGPR